MNLLTVLTKTQALRALDHALAQSLRRLDPTTPDEVLAAAALASLAVAQGHAGFDPTQPARLVEAPLPWPEPQAWIAQLRASRWVATPDDDSAEAEQAPLAWEHGLLYLRRYREYERRLARGLQRIGAAQLDQTDVAALAPLFAQLFDVAATPASTPSLFGEAERGGADHQARAAALALRHALLLVTGGPGTGKTTTIARLLVLLAAQANNAGHPPPRVALAAPTGRAAERMAESLRNAAQQLPQLGVDPALCAQLPTTGTTLHRLLGVIPDSPRFRHHADNPLPFDVVVVDEASMIDLPLMAKLVEAVASGTRLVLLGDPDQLPSVEAGDVLGAILRAAGDGEAITPADAQALQPLLGELPATRVPAAGTFAGARVHLHRGYRQSDALQLESLAAAMREGDATRALSLLRSGELPGVHFHENEGDPLHAWRDPLQRYWDSLATAQTPAQALALASRLRLLTAVREGPQGARGLNARIEELLGGATPRGGAPAHFHGRLLLVTENSYRHRLFNGDVGICLGDGTTRTTTAWFPGDDPESPRPFHPAALPAHESAFAMTVHKAQGSEFDEVWLQLPPRDNRVLSRELLYTGITRARHALHLAGNAGVIEAALSRHASRLSGLAQRLGHRR
ncbi:putative EXONUCLEASE V (ALPHA CHAIN) RECD (EXODEOXYRIBONUCLEASE V ALPHA CHAIN) (EXODEOXYRIBONUCLEASE V POLYPEPTIDE) [uncultured Stenotrophomonas sp.]|uniref:RecBCD enzyme subunit RecD n=1 Tax=uncultured Stenotrophomonas sp. TaxID=165438 RepID=A0A1Y5Q504_9GAMM|nr:putative EXONUCLEASE V (ALPHA CHAIN) RECD (EXODEOXYRIBONUCLEASE V ALPHA CHAIN) (EXODEOXYRIBONUCLEASE V POLYPEPTIDE) [uncultured Stenotrophomonas sp.]